jgi:uroporphyrinogen III methyltransferase/synthase
MSATVYLVGSGPGNPLLITVRGMHLLQRADAVVYDHLASETLLAAVPDSCRLVDVGKRGWSEHLGQDDVSQTLVDLARDPDMKIIVRLKGGDPLVFGRGGEEMAALRHAGIDFQVVPGVTAATAAGAYAGIPLTQRSVSSMLRLVTGNEDPTKQTSDVNWDGIASDVGTTCLYMALRRLPQLVRLLLEGGVDEDLPVAIVERCSSGSQRVIRSTLADVCERVRDEQVESPALVILGDVVAHAPVPSWFESLPLFGLRIMVTRAADQNRSFVEELLDRGADVDVCPVLEMRERPATPRDEELLDHLDVYTWVVFTSARGVGFLIERLLARGLDLRALSGARIAAIGSATARALEERGLRADLVPSRYHSHALADALVDAGLGAHDAVLLPRASLATDELPVALGQTGARCDILPLYDTCLPDHTPTSHACCLRLVNGRVDAVTFTSPSSVRLLEEMLVRETGVADMAGGLPGGAQAFSIGPATSRELRAHGIEPAAEATEHTIPGLVCAIERYYGE